MITTTQWMDETNVDMKKVELILLSEHLDEISELGTIYKNWEIKKWFDKNQIIDLNGRKIEYNYYSFSFEYVSSSLDNTIARKSGFVIPYVEAGSIKYIIDRNSDAQTLLRKMLKYSGKGEISQIKTPFFRIYSYG